MMKQMPGLMGGGKMGGKRGVLQASLFNIKSIKLTNKEKVNWRKIKMAVKIRLRRMGQKKAPYYSNRCCRFPQQT